MADVIATIPKKLYRSGEVTGFTGISRQTLHYYNQIGLIQEAEKTQSGQRLYHEDVFIVIEKIKDYQRQKLTLVEIRDKLRTDAQLKFHFYDTAGNELR
ncbi:MAG: MerR family DNA-binding transcriptional regulator [Candidatus Omnitrophica bacterium]|nr:MerR family DNA-binding transcriptional regulator [Candidatus Omnitrophota bacterium]